jgi:hypothetical protein
VFCVLSEELERLARLIEGIEDEAEEDIGPQGVGAELERGDDAEAATAAP